jgi:hypothetical protein
MESIQLKVTQPDDLSIQLYPHQLSLIFKMEQLEHLKYVECNGSGSVKETRIGLNSDPTGSGKTYTMIGLLCRDKMEWDISLPFVIESVSYEAGGLIKNTSIKRYDKINCNLVLVSPSIIGQWYEEFSNTNLRVKQIISKKDIDSLNIDSYDVVIVTTNMYNFLISITSNYAWKRFIYDEPGDVRVPGMKHVIAGFYWLVTATPKSITSKHYNCRGSMMKDIIGENWWDFDIQFSPIILKNNDKYITSSFNLPPITHHNYHCFQPLLTVVSGIVNPTIKKMIEAENIEDAITALGGKKTKNIVELIKKKKLEELEEIQSKISIYTSRNDREKITEWKTKEKHLNIQINDLSQRFNDMLNNTCQICMDYISNPILEPKCQNIFCGNCILKWLQKNNSCPSCRTTINMNELIYIDNSSPKTQEDKPKITRNMTKLEQIRTLIKDKKDGKFLIFSSYDVTFKPICKMFKENNINFVDIKGTVETRQKNIKKFKTGTCQVIFLNSKLNSAGINLSETTDIILYHEMEENVKHQIIGRAQRIGRKEPLHVHNLIVDI